MVSLYLLMMLTLTDFNKGSPLRDELGWSLLIIVMVTVLVNLVKAIYYDLKALGVWI
jgi:hypothetical protein